MFFELIATITAGLGAAGVALLAGKLSGGRLPRWTIPATAGMAMIAFTIWSEYSWFDRTEAGLPDGMVVVWHNEERQLYRPWTYLQPLATRLTAVDTESVRTHEAQPDQRMVDLYLIGRWSPNHRIRAVFDCDAGRRADLVEGVDLAPNGALEGAEWLQLPPDDPALAAACKRRG